MFHGRKVHVNENRKKLYQTAVRFHLTVMVAGVKPDCGFVHLWVISDNPSRNCKVGRIVHGAVIMEKISVGRKSKFEKEMLI